jgi:hypothetical protein
MVEVVDAEIALTEARIRLAQAEANPARVRALLEELVPQWQQQRQLAQARVEAGASVPDILIEIDAHLIEAKARLEQARAK